MLTTLLTLLPSAMLATARRRGDPILNLDDSNGSIGNIRGNILDFPFQTIATGSSIVLPTFFHVSQAVWINSTYDWA